MRRCQVGALLESMLYSRKTTKRESLRRPGKEDKLFADCDGKETIKELAEMIFSPHKCAVTHNKSLTECMKTGLNGSKTYDNYQNIIMNDITYTDFADKVKQTLKSPDSHIDQCRTAFRIAKCIVDGAECPGSQLTETELVYEKIHNVTMCAQVPLHDLVSL